MPIAAMVQAKPTIAASRPAVSAPIAYPRSPQKRWTLSARARQDGSAASDTAASRDGIGAESCWPPIAGGRTLTGGFYSIILMIDPDMVLDVKPRSVRSRRDAAPTRLSGAPPRRRLPGMEDCRAADRGEFLGKRVTMSASCCGCTSIRTFGPCCGSLWRSTSPCARKHPLARDQRDGSSCRTDQPPAVRRDRTLRGGGDGLVVGLLTAANAAGQLVFLPSMAFLVTQSGWRRWRRHLRCDALTKSRKGSPGLPLWAPGSGYDRGSRSAP